MKRLGFLAVLVVLFVVSIKYFPYHCNSKVCLARIASGQASSHMKKAILGSTSLNITLASTTEAREKGLSGIDSLDPRKGLLFVFDTQEKYGFWMKDMKFDIDIIWIGSDQKVIGFEKNVSKNSYPQVFYPKNEIKYALEMKAGSIDERGIKVGDLLSPTF